MEPENYASVDLDVRSVSPQAEDLRASRVSLQKQLDANRKLTAIVEHASDAISVISSDRRMEYVNPQFEREFGYTLQEILGGDVNTLGWARSEQSVYDEMHATACSGRAWSGNLRSQARNGNIIDHEVKVSPIFDADGRVTHYVQIRRNITERLVLEQQLQQAQKLESIGQLAAGIAHEINTPSQYIGDNTRFLKESFGELCAVINDIRALLAAAQSDATAQTVAALLVKADVEYLLEEIPKAIDQSLEGVGRVASIVRAMKEFSHPSREMTRVDLNRAIESTLTVATSEWKYVATTSLDLDPDLPPVACFAGDINQVVLNIVVNAAHAIGDVVAGTEAKGVIGVSTRVIGQWVEIRISDTGGGIPDQVKAKMFDPFFTTKDVGKGTGQGLSIAHAIIVGKHGGQIDVETQTGKGSCFILRLPLQQPESVGADKAA